MNLMLINGKSAKRCRAFTLMEASIASAIAAMMFGGIIYGYIMSNRSAEWSAYSFAAQSLALQRLEQTRACKWDPDANPPEDSQLQNTNFVPEVRVLDVPLNGTNITYATNVTSISTISTYPPLRMISVETTWQFNGKVYTNSIATYRAPDA